MSTCSTRQSTERAKRVILVLMTSRSYCFTEFIAEELVTQLDGEEDVAPAVEYAKAFVDSLGSAEGVRYCIGQLERCPDTGRLHLQGYVEFSTSKSVRWLKGQ